jgi:hypothetical protein
VDESRRDVLKKAAVAGGLVWSAPVLESVFHAAGAAGTPPPGTTTTQQPGTTTTTQDVPECRSASCGNFIECASACVCFIGSEGQGVCAQGVLCAGLTLCPSGQSDCAANETCIVESCCVDPVCIPNSALCAVGGEGASPAQRVTSSGPTTASR